MTIRSTALAFALALSAVVQPLYAGGPVLIDKGGYFAYERGCPSAAGKTGSGSAYLDTDGDGATDTYTADKNG